MTNPPTDTNALHAARLHADESWQILARVKEIPDDTRPEWEETTTANGVALLSGRVVGPRAVWALERFARDFYLRLTHVGDVRPQFDVSQPGRTALVWRYDGVWVELWHPDTAVDALDVAGSAPTVLAPPVSAQAAPDPKPAAPARSLISRASDRLPFTRNRRKETTTR